MNGKRIKIFKEGNENCIQSDINSFLENELIKLHDIKIVVEVVTQIPYLTAIVIYEKEEK